jgi:2-iminobutanoate/2-iminopropanoate deaminase
MRTLTALLFIGMTASTTMAQTSAKQVFASPAGLPFSAAVRADGLIYVAGTLGTGADGAIVKGGIKAQTQQVLDNMAATLKTAGSTLSQAASVQVYLRDAADFAAMNEVYRAAFPKDPPARTTVIVTELALPGAIVEMSMVAVPAGGERTILLPTGWKSPANPYSYGVKTRSTIFLSGLVGRRPADNSLGGADVPSQTKTVLDNAGALLAAGGMSMADVVSSRVFLTDASKFQDMNDVYRTFFPKDPPARATVKAALTAPDLLVEITLVAVKDASRAAITTPNADGTPGKPNPNLSSAIRAGNRLYLAGMLGNTADTKGDVKAQTAETLARIGRTLKAAGYDWSHVVDGIVYLPQMSRFDEMNAAYREVFTKDFPARATVGTDLMGADGLVEIMFTAVK